MPAERALLVVIQFDRRDHRRQAEWSMVDELQELEELSRSSGCDVVGHVTAKRHQPIAGTFLGEGKLQEIAAAAASQRAQVVIFNQELSPAQQRNIEAMLEVKTIDRTQLILDIFAQRANSEEGKLQVELAQLRYLMPRLVGKELALSRLGGGIGTRGPGEQKLEIDRRRIRVRIARLNDALCWLERRREATRQRRKEAQVPVAALIGYTNAGKTTLLNRLTGASSPARNQLFTTLDPLARRLRLPSGEIVVLTDTVGFLHDLPHHLIDAFHATLEETRDAHLVLHVLDASHPLALQHAKAVEEVLARLELREKPLITILNKQDLIEDAQRLAALAHAYAPSCAISATSGEGIPEFSQLLSDQLSVLLREPSRVRLPAERSDLIAAIYQQGHVLRRTEADGVVELVARIPASLQSLLSTYLIK